MSEQMNIFEKLSNIQMKLKAPKGQFNSYGNYKFRSCEDILEAVKPICNEFRATLILHDDIVLIGDRYYIRATAKLKDWDSDNYITGMAYARESLNKKGMDESQITGTASSYARKYALNGLFNIDDTKDGDTDEYKEQEKKADDTDEYKEQEKKADDKATPKQIQLIAKNYKGDNLIKLLKSNNIEKLEDLSKSKASEICDYIFKKIEEKKQQLDINNQEPTF